MGNNSRGNFSSYGIELLAPAASYDVGRCAIDAGADAVYIGARLFSARAAAGNSIEDIARLCQYAAPFGVRVYLALNTMFTSDDEVKQARLLALQAIEVGVWAIIFQDVRVLDMGLGVELHASTQTFVDSVERARDFERAGVSRLVLERGFSLAQIGAITGSVGIDTEVFVHGAICVGYSGVCSLSEHLTGRSGNRGQCAQPCRSLYHLVDSRGHILVSDESLLSPRDLDLSGRIGELVGVGVRSLKIEGRLKDANYVGNIVAHYHSILEGLGVSRTSWGRSVARFSPDTRLSFNRDFTEWYFDSVKGASGRGGRSVASGSVPGQFIGTIVSVERSSVGVELSGGVALSNGDGLSYRGDSGEISGVRVNRVEGSTIHLLSCDGLRVGMDLYRNFSISFKPLSVRTIGIHIAFKQCESPRRGYNLTATDDCGHSVEIFVDGQGVALATNVERAHEVLKTGLSKCGGTIFELLGIEVDCVDTPFFSAAAVNSLRRELFALLLLRCGGWLGGRYTSSRDSSGDSALGSSRDSCVSGCVSNLVPDYLMRSRYCILGERGMCLQSEGGKGLFTPLHLSNNGIDLPLRFDCVACEMYIET